MPAIRSLVGAYDGHSFAQEASLVFMRLQGMTTLVSQQVAELSNLSQTFCRLVGGKGPLL